MTRVRLLAAALLAAGLLASGLLAGAGGARAETTPGLVLRAGDQPRLSRLVLDLPLGTAWQLDQAGREVALRLPGAALAIDASEIFPGRRAARVLAARSRTDATGTVLLLTLACDCSASAFALGPRKLVIDVTDAPGTAPPPPPPEAEPPAPATDDPAAIEAARRAILERLSKAAEQGLVEFRDPAAESPAPGPAPEPRAAEAPHGTPAEAPHDAAPDPSPDPSPDPPHGTPHESPRAEAVETPPAAEAADPGIEVRTARDRDRPVERPARPPAAPGCLAAERVDLAAWAAEAPFDRQLAEARGALLGEFDRIDPAAVTRLARLYLHHGFGTEAAAVMRDLGPGLADAPLVLDLARAIEDVAPLPDGPLAAQWGCPGLAGLLGLFAATDPATGEVARAGDLADPAAIAAALETLPAIPRRLFGPRLARAYLGRGQPEAAGRLLGLVARAGGDPGEPWALARAAWLDATGAHAEAEAIWRNLVARDRPAAAEALVALTESRLARGLPPPRNAAEDLAARAFERRRAPEGETARAAEIEARAAAGDLPEALALLAESAEPATRAATAARLLARARAEATGGARYAAAVLRHRDLLGEGPEADPARLAVATELLGIGLPNLARDAIAPALTRAAPEPRQLAARAEIALGDPAAALALLDGLEGQAVAELRAEAHVAAGDYPAALAALEGVAIAEERRAALAFAAGMWTEAAAAGELGDRVLAAFMAGLGPEAVGIVPAAAPAAPEGPAALTTTAPARPAPRTPQEAFLTPPRLEEPISLGLAREAISVAQAARDLLASKLAAPPGPGG